jgi:multicomponent Na+:H+ antiporter subunit E
VTAFLTNILLALAWVAMSGSFSPANFLLGLVIGYLLVWFGQSIRGPSAYFRKVRLVCEFAAFVLWELIKANVKVAYDVATPRHHMRPGIVAIPLDVTSDAEITLLANLITLTPGTLTLDVSSDRRVLYMHAMYIGDAEEVKRSIKQGFERRIRELLR